MNSSLRADCARCAALCCVALAFDRGPAFAFDKAAGDPCRNLRPDDACAVHATRAGLGCAGCVAFDCLGAGQRVTAAFAPRHWRDDDETARAIFDAFAQLRAACEVLDLLGRARALPLPDAARARVEDAAAALRDIIDDAALPLAAIASATRAGRDALAHLRTVLKAPRALPVMTT